MVHFATYLIRSPSDAAEIVNDVFLEVWKKRTSLSLDDSLKSYLFTSVKNRCINFGKKNKLILVPQFPQDAISSFAADSMVVEREQLDRVAHIMNILPPKCRQVFAMSRVDELSYREIAELLDISVKTVEAQISKALKIFRKKMNKE